MPLVADITRCSSGFLREYPRGVEVHFDFAPGRSGSNSRRQLAGVGLNSVYWLLSGHLDSPPPDPRFLQPTSLRSRLRKARQPWRASLSTGWSKFAL